MTPFGSKRLVQAAAVLGSITLLAGCSGGGSDADTAASAASAVSSAASAASSAVNSAADEAASAADEAASAAAGAASAAQEAGNEAAEITDEAWREALDQADRTIQASASTAIWESETNVSIAGDCDSLNVGGSDNTIVAEGVGTLTVGGSGNTIYVKNPVTINLLGSENTIVWSGTEQPSISEAGADNTVRQAS